MLGFTALKSCRQVKRIDFPFSIVIIHSSQYLSLQIQYLHSLHPAPSQVLIFEAPERCLVALLTACQSCMTAGTSLQDIHCCVPPACG